MGERARHGGLAPGEKSFIAGHRNPHIEYGMLHSMAPCGAEMQLDLVPGLRQCTVMIRSVRSFLIVATCACAAPAAALAADLPGMTSLLSGLPADEAMGRDFYVQMVMEEARRQGVPPALADAVAVVESGYNVMARGTSGEVGLMQILPSTAAALGFSGSISQLFVPWTNIHYGVAYLARAWSLSGGSVCRALMKYRAGWGEEAFSPLSIDYCARASAYMDANAGQFSGPDTAALAQPMVAAPAVAHALADPYVVTIAPALQAQKTAYAGDFHTRPRAQQDQTSALDARWKSHQRHF